MFFINTIQHAERMIGPTANFQGRCGRRTLRQPRHRFARTGVLFDQHGLGGLLRCPRRRDRMDPDLRAGSQPGRRPARRDLNLQSFELHMTHVPAVQAHQVRGDLEPVHADEGRNVRSAPWALARTPSQLVTSMINMVSARPSTGERTIAISVLLSPIHWMLGRPAWATPAPMMPPTKAWLDDDGSPLSYVTTFQNIAPTSAPNTTAGVIRSLSIRPLPIVSATFCSAGHCSVRK